LTRPAGETSGTGFDPMGLAAERVPRQRDDASLGAGELGHVNVEPGGATGECEQ